MAAGSPYILSVIQLAVQYIARAVYYAPLRFL